MFLIDHAGLPLKTVLEQLDIFGEDVLPVLREEFKKTVLRTFLPHRPTTSLLSATWLARTQFPEKAQKLEGMGGRTGAQGQA